ncbi:MAG: hypothetical protein WB778_02595 [Thermoplasmata archaeon]
MELAGTEVPKRQSSANLALEDPENVRISESMTIEKAVERLKKTVKLADELDYYLLLLTSGQCRALDLLEKVAYLGIHGQSSSGKSRVGRVFQYLGGRVLIAAAVSPKFLCGSRA